MKKNLIFSLFLGIGILLTSSCKTGFERIRATGDFDTRYSKAFEYYEGEEYLKAQVLFELIISELRGKVEAEKVYFYYAYTHYHLGQYILASYYFNTFSRTFTNSKFREEADFMAGYSHYELSPSYRLDQSYSQKAIDAFQLFVNTYPTSKRVSECNNLIDEMRKKMEEKAFAEGTLYFDLRQYQSATQSFENLLRDYPETKDAEEVRFMVVKANYLLAQNSIFDKQFERFNKTLKYITSFKSKYPKSKHTKEIKNILKDSNKKLKKINNVRRY